jgi:hypothetical protein
VTDLAVALRGPSDQAAVLYSGIDFSELGRLVFNATGEPVFGTRTIGAAGDANGDGVPDILVGVLGGGADAGGAVHLFSGASRRVMRVYDGTTCQADNPASQCCAIDPEFGAALTGGDLDGDGLSDIVIGAPAYDGYPDSGDERTGRVYVFYSRPATECPSVSPISTRMASSTLKTSSTSCRRSSSKTRLPTSIGAAM